MTALFNSGLSQQQFLDEYWQKKPLLIRQAFADFKAPITPEELAGLACEPEIESRLIAFDPVTGDWHLTQGPLSETVFSRLPDTHWTILVQDVDKHLTKLQPLLTSFNFLPDWRRDDLMISYAVQGGSVGPHTDSYDVFLLQAMGIRCWKISTQPLIDPELLTGVDLQILAEFDSQQEWILEPGDMLYLPPHFAHYGIALDEGMTFSIGLRAPTQMEIMDAVLETLYEQGKGQQRYADPDLTLNSHTAEIDAQTVQRVRQCLMALLDTSAPILATAMGKLVTQTKPTLEELAYHGEEIDTCSPKEISRQFTQGARLQRNPYLRFAWSATVELGQIFIAGEAFQVPKSAIPLLPVLTEQVYLTHSDWQKIQAIPALAELLCQWVADGYWLWSASEQANLN